MADLEAYKDKFGESGQRVLQNALNESRRRDQNYIAVEHILSGLAKEEPDLFNRLTAEFLAQVDSGRFRLRDPRSLIKSTMAKR